LPACKPSCQRDAGGGTRDFNTRSELRELAFVRLANTSERTAAQADELRIGRLEIRISQVDGAVHVPTIAPAGDPRQPRARARPKLRSLEQGRAFASSVALRWENDRILGLSVRRDSGQLPNITNALQASRCLRPEVALI
jgi:hypothetical protein